MKARKLNLKTLDELIHEVNQLHEHGYDKAGQWDLAQCLDHLGKFMTRSVHGFDFKVPFFLKLFGPYFRKKALKTNTIPSGFKTFPALEPRTDKSEDETIQWFKNIVEEVRQCKTFHPSPLMGKMDRDTWIQIHLIHSGLHLSFLIPK